MLETEVVSMGCMISKSRRDSGESVSTLDSKSIMSGCSPEILPEKIFPKASSVLSGPGSSSSSAVGSPRMKDRINTGSMSLLSSGGEEYADRDMAQFEEGEEIQIERLRREKSMVQMAVSKYNQLDAQSKVKPKLMTVERKTLNRQSTIYGRVQSFEMGCRKQENEGEGLSIEEIRKRRESKDPRRFANTATVVPIYSL